jgi:hypothetical protein
VRATLLLLALLALAPTAAACDGLSPGDELNADNKRCTLAWLVADAKGLYFATAGHCIAEGSRAYNPALDVEFGTGVFSYDQDGPGVDFALIEVDPEDYDKVNPRMCEWGGPTGIYRDTPSGGMVYHFGYGDVLGQNPLTRARPGFELYWDGGAAFYWTGLGVTGDSGSAVVHADGRAVGVLTHLTPGMVPSNNGGTHLDAGFALAAERGYDLRLVLEGEDPVAVLREMQGAPPPTTTPPGDDTEAPTGDDDATANGTAPPGPSGSDTPPASNDTPTDGNGEPLDPQRASGATTAESKGVPAPALPLLVAAVLLVAALRRR